MKKILKKLISSLTITLILFTLVPTPTSHAAWINDDWNYRVMLSTDENQIPSDQTDIQLYVDLSNMPSEFFTNVNPDGSDIRVTDSDEITELEFELVSINTLNQTGELHVKVPNLPDNSSHNIYIYYGNSSASSVSTPNIWSDHRAVWHLDEPIPGSNSSTQNIGIATQLAMDGGDGSWINLFGESPVTNQIQLVADEDQINDAERSHTSEEVNYVAFKTSEETDLLNQAGTIIGEIGIIEDVNNTPIAKTLRNTYVQPIIVTTPVLPDDNTNPAVVRIDSITASTFSPYLQNPGDLVTPTSRDIHYIVIETGTHLLPGGTQLEAGKVTTSTNPNAQGNWNQSQQIKLNPTNSYNSPIILGQVLTNNDPLWQNFWTSNGSQTGAPNSSNIYIGRHVGHDAITARANEDLGYIILEKSSGFTNSTEWSAKKTSDSIQGVDNDPPYSYTAFSSTLSGVFKDSTINSFNADHTGNITAQETGKISNAINLSGDAESKLDIGGLNYNSSNGLNELTASLWLKTTDTARSGILDFDRSEHWEIGLNFHNAGGDSGKISFDTANQADGIKDLNSSIKVNDDQWHHVVVVYDKNAPEDKKIYIDGQLSISADQHSDNGLGKSTTRYGFIGDGSEANTQGGNTNNLLYEGLIDEIRIQHQAKSADFILTTYNNQNDNSSFWTFSAEEANNLAPTQPSTPYVNSIDAQAGQTNPSDLTIGGADNRQVFFSAIYEDPNSGDIANAAQIQVSTDSSFASITHWDSGMTTITDITESNRSSNIGYDDFGNAADQSLSMDDGNTTYYWRIRFQDDSNEAGPYSEIGSFSLLDIPNQPANLSVIKVDGSPDTFDLAWQDTSNNEENFEIQSKENTGAGFTAYSDISNSPTPSNTNTVSDTNTTANAAYMYQVRSCNYAGCSPYTEDPSTHFTDPLSPINVYSDYDNDNQFTVNYTDRSVVNQLDIEHCIGTANCEANSYTIIDSGVITLTGVPASSVDNTGIIPNQIYRWRARVNNGSTSEYTYSPYEYTSPANPTQVQANYINDSLIELTWTDNSAFEEGFKIEISEDGGAFTELTPGQTTTSSNITSYLFTEAQADKNYEFQVTAIISDTTYNTERTSSSVSTGNVLSTPEAPTDLTATYVNDNDISLTWTDNSSFEDGFKIYYSENNGPFTLETTVATDSTSYSFTSANGDSTYTFQVESIVDANPPNNPQELAALSNDSNTIVTTPNSPTLTLDSISNSTIDWTITDNSNIESGFIIYDADGETEIARLAASNLTSWTESGLSPNTEVQRYIAAYATAQDQDDLISPLSPLVTVYTLANAPAEITTSTDLSSKTVSITWTDGDNPIGTEFIAENLTTSQNSGWSTDLNWEYSESPECEVTHQIQVKSRNQDLTESFAEIVEIVGPECRRSGSSSTSSSTNPLNTYIKTPTLACNTPTSSYYKITDPSTISQNETNYIFIKNQKPIIFEDFPVQQWGAEYIQTALNYKIISGYNDQQMKPNQSITSGEFSKILVNSLNLPITETQSVQTNHWSAQYINTLLANNILVPNDPNQLLTRKQVIQFTAQGYKLPQVNTSTINYGDENLDQNFLKNFVNPLTEIKALKGYNSQNNQKPLLKLNQNVTRLEAIKIILITNNHCNL
jgi:hypothetical protein